MFAILIIQNHPFDIFNQSSIIQDYMKTQSQIDLASLIYHSPNHNAKNIVLHHGLLGCAEHFSFLQHNHQLTQLYNLHLIDARNHGKSPHCATHTIQDLADDLYHYLKSQQLLDEHRKVSLVGHSMGGYALMQFRKKYDSEQIQRCIDKIILVDNSAYPIGKLIPFIKTGEMLIKLAAINLNRSLGEIHKQIEHLSMSTTLSQALKNEVMQFGQDGYRWRPNMSLLVGSAFKQIGEYDLAANNPARWKTQVEIIYGGESGQFSEEQLQKYCLFYPYLTAAKCHRIEHAGHWVHFGNPQMFSTALLKILAP